jgi:hypothetical protein
LNILGISKDREFARLFQCLKTRDDGLQFHAIVCGVLLAAKHFTCVAAEA